MPESLKGARARKPAIHYRRNQMIFASGKARGRIRLIRILNRIRRAFAQRP